MNRPERPRDETRRRVLVGLGALGAGALGAGIVLASAPGDEAVGDSIPPVPRGATPSAPQPTSPSTTPAPMVETTVEAQQTANATAASVVSIEVACRTAWGAEPVSGAMVEHQPVRLTLHHTAVSQTASTQGPARVRQHQAYHQSLGWPDLAYHYLVDRSGRTREGEYDPTGHFLVCMEGDFDVQEPTQEQLDTTVALFAWASQQYRIDASTLTGHGDYAPSTTCPGSAVSAMIPELAETVARTGPVAIDLACGRDGAELVAALEAG